MRVGELTQVTGCFTQFKFLAGRSPGELERLIGYQPGRLAAGAVLLELLSLPRVDDFELIGYSNVATHNFQFPAGLNPDVLKREARNTWTATGPNKLVKVWPTTPHNRTVDLDTQYPHAAGIPQWTMKKNVFIPARVLLILNS